MDDVNNVNFELRFRLSFRRSRSSIALFLVVSNTPWKIQVWMRNSVIDSSAGMQLRSQGREYFALSGQPQILAQGLNGVFEISIDYRILLEADGRFASQVPQEVVYTIMSD